MLIVTGLVCLGAALVVVAVSARGNVRWLGDGRARAGSMWLARHWSWQAAAMGLGCPYVDACVPTTECRSPESADELSSKVWKGSQLILVTNDGDSLLLDCVVPMAKHLLRHRCAPAVPITLRAHCIDPSALNTEDTIRAWADGGAAVDVCVCHEAGVPLVRVCHNGSTMTLELEATHTAA